MTMTAADWIAAERHERLIEQDSDYRAALAEDRVLDEALSGAPDAARNLEVGEYGEEDAALSHLLLLAADARRGGNVDTEAFKRAAMALLAEVVSNRDYAYWERVDGNHRAFTKAYPMPELPSIRRAA